MRAGRSPTAIVLYRGTLFVGAVHRILQQDSKLVYEEAKRRFSGIFDLSAVQALSDVQCSGGRQRQRPSPLEVPEMTRRLSLERQRKVDDLENKLASLRLERLFLIYERAPDSLQEPRLARSSSKLDILRDDDRQSRAHRRVQSGQNPSAVQPSSPAERIEQLQRAEAILEAAVMLLWQDPRWIAKSIPELLRGAGKLVNAGKPQMGVLIDLSAEQPIEIPRLKGP